jgi:hypothetical protein
MNPFQHIFDTQNAYFATNFTRSYEWRIDRLNSLEAIIAEKTPQLRTAIAADFKTTRQEFEFETDTAIAEIDFQKSQLNGWMEPVEEPIYSGSGYYGRCGFDQLTHAKSVVVAPADVAIDHLYPPATDDKIAEFNSKCTDYWSVGS